MPSLVIEYVPGSDQMAPDLPGLKPPYKYRMPLAQVQKTLADLKDLVSGWKVPHGEKQREMLQYSPTVSSKPVKYGVRLHFWLLCMKIEDFGPDRGCSEKEWKAYTAPIVEFLKERFPGCNPYVEGWKSRKPQFRFDTYVRYSEFG